TPCRQRSLPPDKFWPGGSETQGDRPAERMPTTITCCTSTALAAPAIRGGQAAHSSSTSGRRVGSEHRLLSGVRRPQVFATLVGTTQGTTFHVGLVLTALGFGFRHGIDWDHIAALTDIVGSHKESRRSMICATFYALGHALMVLALGLAAIVL